MSERTLESVSGFTKQLTNEKIPFTIYSEEKYVNLTPNNDEQWEYFLNHFNNIRLLDFCTHIIIEFENIPEFDQVVWSGLIPATN